MRNKLNIVVVLMVIVVLTEISSAYADTLTFSAEIENSLSLSLSNNTAALTLNPGTTPFSTSSITTTVGTNNETGYNIVVTAETTDLTRTEALSDNTTPTIPTLETLTGGYTESSFTANHWGYNKGSGNWLPFETNIELGRTTEPSNADTRTMNFATKVDYTKPSGTYNITLNFVATANIPVAPTRTMQSVDSAFMDTLEVGDVITLKDSRGTNTPEYQVSVESLGGKKTLWMNDNLKLPAGTTLTPQDSNVTSEFTLSTEQWTSSAQDYECKQIMAVHDDDYYYNWFAATANSYVCSDPYSDDEWQELVGFEYGWISPTDICPNGWRLPNLTDLSNMYEGYNQAESYLAGSFLRSDLAGSFSSGHVNGDGYYDGECGLWWSSTDTVLYWWQGATSVMYDSDGVSMGYSVRCLYDGTDGNEGSLDSEF